MTYDAIVIGGGHNGLVAGNLLVDAGWSVLLLEEQPTVGGAVRSTELLGPGFVTDEFSAFYPLGAGSPVLRGLQLEQHGLSWVHAPAVLAHLFPDDRCAVLSRSLEATEASVDAFSPGDGRAWRSLVDQWSQIGDDVIDALFTPFPPLVPTARLLRQLGGAEALRFARFAVTPVRQAGLELFDGEGAAMLLAGCAGHTDLSPTDAGSAMFGWLLCMLGQSVGFPVPEGGSGRLTEALLRRYEAGGGQVTCEAAVEKVLISEGRATGVLLRDGSRLSAERAVVANVDAPTLYRDLVGLERLPGSVRSDLRRFVWDPSTLKVNWSLREPIPWISTDARGAGTVHLDVDMTGLVDFNEDLIRGRMPSAPFLVLGQMTTTDASRSPAGTEVVWCYSHVPRELRDDAAALAEQVRRIEAVLERHAPGFADLVLSRVVQTPADLENANSNLVGGAINGGTAKLHQELVFRPLPSLGRAETPIRRLYLASASAHPGGGVHGGPGANAARAALLHGRRRSAPRAAALRLSQQVLLRAKEPTRRQLADDDVE